MPRLGHFSGKDICRIFEQHGFQIVRQRGSHAVMQKRDGVSTITVSGADASRGAYRNPVVYYPSVRPAAISI